MIVAATDARIAWTVAASARRTLFVATTAPQPTWTCIARFIAYDGR